MDPAGAVAFLVAREQGKLTHDQYLAVDLLYILIHYAVFVVENAECGGFSGQPIGGFAIIVVGNAEENHQALIYAGRHFAIDADGGVFDALDYCLHSFYRYLVGASRRSNQQK